MIFDEPGLPRIGKLMGFEKNKIGRTVFYPVARQYRGFSIETGGALTLQYDLISVFECEFELS